MSRRLKFKLLPLLVAGAALHAPAARACAACFGASDSPLAEAMNWGIFSLLAVVVSVLGGIAGFFIYLARKSAAVAAPVAPLPQGELLASPQKA